MKELLKEMASELLVPLSVAYGIVAPMVQIIAYKKFKVW